MFISGPGVVAAYPKMFLNSDYRKLMNFQPEYAANIRGLVYLIAGGKIFSAVYVAIVGVLSAFLLWLTAKIWKDSEFDLSFSAAVITALLTGLHAFIYDLSLLLLPVSIVCGELAKRSTLLRNSILSAVLIVLFVPPVHYVLITYHVYALMCLPVAVLFVSVARTVAQHTTEA